MATSINRLGLIVAGISIVAVLLVFGIVVGVRSLLNKEPEATPTPVAITSPAEQLVDSTDSDSDGIPDEVEPIYRTDKQNPDTDGDGTNDGDELILLRDPLTPGPDDTLDILSQQTDASTYTGRYIALLPADATQNEVLSQERLEAFVEDARLPLLPEVPPSSIKQTTDSGKEAVATYLATIASSHNTQLHSVSSDDIMNAFRASYAENKPEQLQTIITQLEENLAVLRAAASPEETVSLHQKLLAASEALITNVKLLQGMKSDFVGGLVGAKNIEELGKEFNDIATQITALETKYGLE